MATSPPAVPVKCAGPSPPTSARIRVARALPKTAQKGCPGRLWGQEGHVAAGHQRRQHTRLGVCRCPYMMCLGNRPTYRTSNSLMWPSACPRSTPSPTCRSTRVQITCLVITFFCTAVFVISIYADCSAIVCVCCFWPFTAPVVPARRDICGQSWAHTRTDQGAFWAVLGQSSRDPNTGCRLRRWAGTLHRDRGWTSRHARR